MLHAMAEAKRLSSFDHSALLHSAELSPADVLSAKKAVARRELLVLAGPSGSGVGLVGAQLFLQLRDRLPGLSMAAVDFALVAGSPDLSSEKVAEFVAKALTSCPSAAQGSVLVVVTLCAAVPLVFSDLLAHLAVALTAKLALAVSVVAPSALWSGGAEVDG